MPRREALSSPSRHRSATHWCMTYADRSAVRATRGSPSSPSRPVRRDVDVPPVAAAGGPTSLTSGDPTPGRRRPRMSARRSRTCSARSGGSRRRRSSPRRQRRAASSTTRRPPTGWRSGPRRRARSPGPRPGTQTLDWSDAPFAKWFVGGSSTSPYNCVDRHVEAGHGDQVAYPLRGRARRHPDHHLRRAAARGLRAANALTELGVGTGDRVAIYLPMIPEAVDRDAGVRADRRAALGRVRRLLRRGAAPTGSRTPRPRSSSPPTAATAAARRVGAEAGRRRGAARSAPDVQHVLVVRRTGQDVDVDRGPRRVVARRRRAASRPSTTPRAVRRRAPALHPLHLGHDREAEGHPAHHRRLPDPGRLHAPRRLRPQARRRRLLVHRRHRLGHRPQLHRLRPAGEPRDAR